VAPAGTGAGDEELVADEVAVSVGQDGWSRMPAIIGCSSPIDIYTDACLARCSGADVGAAAAESVALPLRLQI
jgi:hypothetical protein